MSLATRTEVFDDLTPVRAYAALRAHGGPTFLLESAVAGERWGRFSILGFSPRVVRVLSTTGDPLADVARVTRGGGGESLAERLATAEIGVFPYDMVHALAPVRPPPGELLAGRVLGESTVVVFDHLRHTVSLAGPDAADLERAIALLRTAPALDPIAPPDPAATPKSVDVSLDDAAYEAAVVRAKEYIAAGDAFQIVPARTFSTPRAGRDALDVYRALRILSPAPYMYLVELPADGAAPALAVAGASPETLVRLEGGVVTLRPIAGTRRRGRTADEDRAMAEELLADPKERAEHVMLIDLARNDVGRVAATGSVALARKMEIERFSHVMHIVSEVTGRVRPEVSPRDVLRAAFPAGTLTGAPKVRAMQIIAELEGRPRGVYGGAIGYVTASGELDLAIAIRTLVLRGDAIEVTAGAGVVEASEPRLEALETRNKASAALAAVAAIPPR